MRLAVVATASNENAAMQILAVALTESRIGLATALKRAS